MLWLVGPKVASLSAMPLNELGDFLAGVFGPVAILWLILGFFQQGVELRQNTRALNLQAQELSNSVEQQRQLVEVSREQMKAELEVIHLERQRATAAAQPKFVFQGVGGMHNPAKTTYTSHVKNVGNTATDVLFAFDQPMGRSTITNVPSWSNGEIKMLEFEYATPHAETENILRIDFRDAAGAPGSVAFRFKPVPGEPYAMVEISKHVDSLDATR